MDLSTPVVPASVKGAIICLFLVLIPLLCVIHNDYQKFLSLGPGGTPPTLLGYCRITFLRLFVLSDPFTPIDSSNSTRYTKGYYQANQLCLPNRSGPRPEIAGIAPQRQLDQTGCSQMYQLLRSNLEYVAVVYNEQFYTNTSCFERNGLALFSRRPINATCNGEICHVHHSDRSLHMSLHPDDAKIFIEKGWAERHPLARGGWLKAYVPREFVMVYAPRDQNELDVVLQIIEAAVFWVCGERLVMKGGRREEIESLRS